MELEERMFKPSVYSWTYKQHKCPVCGEWQFRVKMHIALKKDKAHKKFYKKHSKLKLIRTINI